jgi:hypothetical protein
MREVVGFSWRKRLQIRVYEVAGIGPADLDVVELHDCFRPKRVAELRGAGPVPGWCAEKFVDDGDNTSPVAGSHNPAAC